MILRPILLAILSVANLQELVAFHGATVRQRDQSTSSDGPAEASLQERQHRHLQEKHHRNLQGRQRDEGASTDGHAEASSLDRHQRHLLEKHHRNLQEKHHRNLGASAHRSVEATIAGDSEVTIKPMSELQKPIGMPMVGDSSDWLPATHKINLHNLGNTEAHSIRKIWLKRSVANSVAKMPRAPSVMVGVGLILLAGLLGAGVAAIVCVFTQEKGASTTDPPEVIAKDKDVMLPAAPQRPSWMKVIYFVFMQAVCASMLPIANKFTLTRFRPAGAVPGTAVSETYGYVWTLMVIQFLAAALVARAAGAFGFCSVTSLQLRKAVAFFPAASMFMVTLVAGNAVMNFANVNAFLVLRSLVPIPCALAETLIYRDRIPPLKSMIGLLVIICGAVGYGMSVGHLEMKSLNWAVIYLVMMPIDGLLIKHAISSLDITPWGFVYYNNILAAIPAACMMVLFEVPNGKSLRMMTQVAVSPEARGAIVLASLAGVFLSYFQLRTRYFLSATGFMVLGIFNKFATIAFNSMFEHQGIIPMAFIAIALTGAITWQMVMRGSSIKLRDGSMPLDTKNVVLPVAVACSAVMWAAYVEWRLVV